MRKVFLAAILFGALIMSGCGSEISIGTTITVPEYYSPEIYSLQLTQDRYQETVSGSFEFVTYDNYLDSMTVVVQDSRGIEVSRSVTDLSALWGYYSGILDFSIDYYTFPSGQYTFTVYVTDRAGYFSNGLYGTFTTY